MRQYELNEMPVELNGAVGREVGWAAVGICTPFTIEVLSGTLVVILPRARVALLFFVPAVLMFTMFWAIAPLHETHIQLGRYLVGRQESRPPSPLLNHPEWAAAPSHSCTPRSCRCGSGLPVARARESRATLKGVCDDLFRHL